VEIWIGMELPCHEIFERFVRRAGYECETIQSRVRRIPVDILSLSYVEDESEGEFAVVNELQQ
jgi:hypothetical protein